MRYGTRVIVGLASASLLAVSVWAGPRERATKRAENREERHDEAKEKATERREEAKEKATERREEAKEKATERREEAKEKAEERREDMKEKAAEAGKRGIDQRQENQKKRIEHGIRKGYLTESEVTQITQQQKAIADLEEQFRGDGKLTGEERKTLQKALNDASRSIWSEKHDADGNQMAVYRLGKTIYAQESLTTKLQDENLSKTDARALSRDFHRILALQQKLAGDDLDEAQRTKLQAEYNELLNKYFEVRDAG